MTNKAILLGALGFIFVSVAACSSATPSSFPDRIFTAPWSMEASAVERLRIKVDSINLGDKVDHVVSTMGVPDSDHTVRKNKTNRIFTYYITRHSAGTTIESDKIVQIAFDNRSRVKAIYSNVEFIATRNWPGY